MRGTRQTEDIVACTQVALRARTAKAIGRNASAQLRSAAGHVAHRGAARVHASAAASFRSRLGAGARARRADSERLVLFGRHGNSFGCAQRQQRLVGGGRVVGCETGAKLCVPRKQTHARAGSSHRSAPWSQDQTPSPKAPTARPTAVLRLLCHRRRWTSLLQATTPRCATARQRQGVPRSSHREEGAAHSTRVVVYRTGKRNGAACEIFFGSQVVKTSRSIAVAACLVTRYAHSRR